MLIEESLADNFLLDYQMLMTYINNGEIPNGLRDFKYLRDELYDCIDEVKENMAHLVSSELLKSLDKAVFGRFIYLKKYKNGYVFYHPDSNVFYQVKGLTTPIEEVCSDFSVVETAILPFSGELICDGLMGHFDVSFGTTIKKEFRDGYWAAKKNGSLVKTV